MKKHVPTKYSSIYFVGMYCARRELRMKNWNNQVMGLLLMLSGCTSVNSKISSSASQEWQPVPYSEHTVIVKAPTFDANGQYNLADLLDLGLSKNPQTRSAWWHAKQVLAQSGRTNSQFFPTISAHVDANRKQTGAVLGAAGTKIDNWGPSLQVSYRLFQFGASVADAKRAACTLAAANYDFNNTLQTVVFTIQQCYHKYVSAIATIEACENNLKDAEASFEAVQNKQANGLARIQDVLLAKADKLQADYELQSARSALESARAELALAVGVPVSKQFEVVIQEGNVAGSDLTEQVEDLLQEALQKRSDLLSAEANLHAKDWDYLKTQREVLPAVDLIGNIGTLRYNKERNWQRNYGIGIGVSWNLFDGFDTQYKKLESYAALKNQTYLFHQQQLQVLRDVWSTFHAFQSSVQLLDSAKALESAAKESFIAIRTGYDAGLNSLLDLLSAQKTLSQARVKRISSQSNLAINWVQLAYVTGRLQTENF